MARVATGLNSLKYINWDEVREILGEHPPLPSEPIPVEKKSKPQKASKPNK